MEYSTYVFKNSLGDLVFICEKTVELAKELLAKNYFYPETYKLIHGVSPYNKIGIIYKSSL